MTLPVLILLACGTMDFARVFYAGIVVESAARSGVQYGSYNVGRPGAHEQMVAAAERDAVGQGLTGITFSSRSFCACNTGSGEVSCSTGICSGGTPNGYAETTASYTFNPLIPYPGIPRDIVVTSSAKFRAQ